MKKQGQTVVRIIALVLALLMILGAVVAAVISFADPLPKNHYSMNIYLHEDKQALEVSQTVAYVNDTGGPLDYVIFRLYANAYRRADTVPFEAAAFDDAFPDGYAPGGVDFMSVYVNGQPAEWGVLGDNESSMRVACPLEMGATATFQFDYYVLLPKAKGILGAGDLDWRLAAFYPIAAVYDPEAGDFVVEPYAAIGGCFYSDVADYSVTFNAPPAYRLGATGKAELIGVADQRATWQIEARDVRDFALVVSRKYSEYSAQAGDTTVKVLVNDAAGARTALDAAQKAVELFGEWFGKYPYDSLTLAQSDYMGGGASFPGLILLDQRLFARSERGALEREVAMMVARQWFSGIVGSNPAQEPWLQETLSEYAALLYAEQVYGHDAYLAWLNQRALDALKMTIPGGMYVDSAAAHFSSAGEFDLVVRGRGAAVMHLLRDAMGEKTFMAALRLYAQNGWLKNVASADFFAALEAAGGKPWSDYVAGLIQTIGEYVNQQFDGFE